MSRKLNWAVIGCGAISKSHCDAIMVAEETELYAVCDIIEEKAKAKAEIYGVKNIYTDYKEMLKNPEIDVVSICTPSGMHGEMAVEVARAGKHVLVEKPMEITKAKIDKMIEELEATNVKVGCVFQRRTEAKFEKVKEAVESGRFGKLLLAEASMKMYRSQAYYDSGEWRGTWELDGGGCLMNQAVHMIDLFIWLAGKPKKISAKCRTLARNIEVEDTVVATLEFENGAIGTLVGATSVTPAQAQKLHFHFENGSITVGDNGIEQWAILDSDEGIPEVVEPTFGGVSSDPTKLPATSHVIMVKDLANAINNDTKPMITPREGRVAVDFILDIYESSKGNKEIVY